MDGDELFNLDDFNEQESSIIINKPSSEQKEEKVKIKEKNINEENKENKVLNKNSKNEEMRKIKDKFDKKDINQVENNTFENKIKRKVMIFLF